MNDYEMKKRLGLIFTLHNINPKLPYDAIDKRTGLPICEPDGASWWSRLSGRYRDAHEQAEFVESGCVDKKLPPIRLEVRYCE